MQKRFKRIRRIDNKIGTAMLLLNLARSWASVVNFLMILYLYITQNSNIYLVLLIPSILLFVVLFDYKFIYPRFLSKTWGRNPEYRNIIRKLDKIEKQTRGSLSS